MNTILCKVCSDRGWVFYDCYQPSCYDCPHQETCIVCGGELANLKMKVRLLEKELSKYEH